MFYLSVCDQHFQKHIYNDFSSTVFHLKIKKMYIYQISVKIFSHKSLSNSLLWPWEENITFMVCPRQKQSTQPWRYAILYQTRKFWTDSNWKHLQTTKKCNSNNDFFFFEKIVETGENAGCHHFLLFAQSFQKLNFQGLLKLRFVSMKSYNSLPNNILHSFKYRTHADDFQN